VRQAEGRAEAFAEVHPMLFRDGQEDIDDFGIELSTGATADFFAGMANGKRFAIRAVADHGVERIRNGKYAGAERNLLAFEAARIAGAVKKFLVRENDFSGVAQKGNSNKHVVADLTVAAHDLFFVVI